MNINCRSIYDKKAEFHSVVDYTKPDIIIGTESWLEGIKPGLPPSKTAIKDYRTFRNDRDSKGGGVFLCIHSDITATETPDLVTNCESVWAKLKLASSKDLYVGSQSGVYSKTEDKAHRSDTVAGATAIVDGAQPQDGTPGSTERP